MPAGARPENSVKRFGGDGEEEQVGDDALEEMR